MSDITQAAPQRSPLGKILDAAESALTPVQAAAENFMHSGEAKVAQAVAAVEQYAPLLERAPALTKQTIAIAFEELAKHCEATADAIMQAAMQRAAEAKHTADQIRQVGAAHAINIENLMTFARDAGALFKDQAQKALSFAPADTQQQ